MLNFFWDATQGRHELVIAGVMLAGVITAFVWGYVIGASQSEIDDETD
jgi:hypothetical protein